MATEDIDLTWRLLGLAWGIAVSVVATLQLAFALRIDFAYDRHTAPAFLIGPRLADRLLDDLGRRRATGGGPGAAAGRGRAAVSWDLPRDPETPRPSL